MSKPKNKVTFATLITLCSIITLICGQTASAQDKLIIISPHWEGIETEFDTAFKAWYAKETGREVNVDWLDQGGSSSDFRFIESEFKRLPEGIGIDLFFGGGTDNYLKLADKGLLASLQTIRNSTGTNPQGDFWHPCLRSRIPLVRRGAVNFRHHVQ